VDEADESDELENPRQSEPRRSDQFPLSLLLSDELDSCNDTEEFESDSETEVMEMDSGYSFSATGAGATISSISCGVKPLARAKVRLSLNFWRMARLIRVVWWSRNVLRTSRARA
jgi:hypothetical protein